jgi:hypothetical protein
MRSSHPIPVLGSFFRRRPAPFYSSLPAEMIFFRPEVTEKRGKKTLMLLREKPDPTKNLAILVIASRALDSRRHEVVDES